MFAEKVLPAGERVAQALAAVLVAFGIWVAFVVHVDERGSEDQRQALAAIDYSS